jgi:hypothetical protein
LSDKDVSNDFTVTEKKGEKIYKLITATFPPEGIKIISKEAVDGKIHFCIYIGKVDVDTKEFITSRPRYRSPESGVTKEAFEGFLGDTLVKMPETAEITVNDLSAYSTLKEQYSAGLNRGIMKVKGVIS